MESLEGLDWGTYSFFRLQAGQVPGLEPFMRAGRTAGCIWIVSALLLATLALLWKQGRRRAAGLVLGGVVISVLLVTGTRLATNRPRPPDAQNYLVAHESPASFPSGPVFMVTLTGLMLVMALGRVPGGRAKNLLLYGTVVLWIVWVSLAQMCLGLHFLTDILAGMAGGAGLALLVRHLESTTQQLPDTR